ncbi:Histone-lysine N-methyltransferase setd3 [Phytophthora citrophthora]|uniref:Histone-lysine N-methyltransferase setd3 n=1 Tax=Phytophthora citrophthora TaxID=4793 RepID=A0AAD9LRV8_9STRA|nr:Histone-lysine N-methyltransferase setd3 [Phytophthora citrophthora]
MKVVKENDKLLFVPKNIIICYDTIAQEWKSEPKLRNKLAKLESDQEELLTAFLILEQAKGQASQWAPYLQLLPSFVARHEVASPLLFETEKDIEALQDERMIQSTKAERQRAIKAHRRFKRLFHSLVDSDLLVLPRYLWARFLVNSRAFSIRGQRVLVPFGDIFNGEPDNEVRQHDNGQRFLQFHELQLEGMTIRADRDTLSKEQLFEDYGDNNNYVYFLHHGFLMRDRGFDCASVHLPSLADVGDQGDMLAAKSRVLSRIRVEDAPSVCMSRNGKPEDSGLVRIYTAVFKMEVEQITVCNNAESFSECFPADVISDFDAEPGYEEVSLLLSSVSRQQERYPTTLEEDLAILHGLSELGSKRHAVAFRVSRKLILHDAQKNLEKQLKLLEEEEAKTKLNEDPIELVVDTPDSGINKLDQFQRWITRHQFPINHLELRYISEAVGYGTFATKGLSTGDVYLKVPIQVVMNVRSAVKSRWVSELMLRLQKHRADIHREEILLLLHLLEEKFGPNHLQSYWKPYLDMLPVLDDFNTLGSPLFYDEDGEQLKMLGGTDLPSLVMNYRNRVAQSYSTLSAHLKSDEWLTERRFRWANAILDSRSIWWNSQRHLVPLLDMVNCRELSSDHKPHHTKLDSSGRHAVTKASWNFEAGQEIVENYAQPNYIYLLYHGFVLVSNSHDCAHFHLELPVAARQRDFSVLLRNLEIYSWTPDVCVTPNDNQDVMKFSKIAFFISDPKTALKFLGNAAASTPSQAFASALQLVEERFERLQSAEAKTLSTTDFRTKSIHKFRHQQLQHLEDLRNVLNRLQK